MLFVLYVVLPNLPAESTVVQAIGMPHHWCDRRGLDAGNFAQIKRRSGLRGGGWFSVDAGDATVLKPRGVVGLVAARTGTVSATGMPLKARYMRYYLICQPKEEIYDRCPFTMTVISSGVGTRNIISTSEMSRKNTWREVETRHKSIKTCASAASSLLIT